MLDKRIEDIESLLRAITALGELSEIGDNYLSDFRRRLEDASATCQSIKDRHLQKRPSAIWLLLSVGQTVGSLAMTPVAPAALIVAAGGVLSAAKSVYDFNHYNQEASTYFALHWEVDRKRITIDAIIEDRRRRG